MPILDLNSATASLTGVAAFGALAAVTGDTLVVRNFDANTEAVLLGFGRKGITAGMARIRSPYFADDIQGIRGRVLAADASSIIDEQGDQNLHAQDTLIFESTGGAAAEQESGWVQNWYASPGMSQTTLLTSAEATQRAVEVIGTEVPVVGGAVATWGAALLNTGTGVLKANANYAVLGYVLDVACTAIALLGPDTGNFNAGGPGLTTKQFTRNYFAYMSDRSGLPCIPVINSANAGGTQVKVVDSGGATAVNVNLILARLGS
jgi:hypothetical protein